MDINTIPLVLQYNKRDLEDIYSVDELEDKLNRYNAPHYEAVAVTGEGVFPTLKKVPAWSWKVSTGSRVRRRFVRREPSSSPRSSPSPSASGLVPVRQRAPGLRPLRKLYAKVRPRRSFEGRWRSRGRRSADPVVKDRVVRSPDVKPIERRQPPKAASQGVGQAAHCQVGAPGDGRVQDRTHRRRRGRGDRRRGRGRVLRRPVGFLHQVNQNPKECFDPTARGDRTRTSRSS